MIEDARRLSDRPSQAGFFVWVHEKANGRAEIPVFSLDPSDACVIIASNSPDERAGRVIGLSGQRSIK